jgi:hypothetical protein
MEYQRIHVKEDGIAKILCPRCSKVWAVSEKKLKGKYRFQVRCDCDSTFQIELDNRGKHRRQTDLDAFVELINRPERWGKIISDSETVNPQSANSKIKNVSSIGIGLTLFKKHKIKEGDRIIIKFSLSKSELSRIEKKAIVRQVEDNYIGCEFFEEDKYDRRMAFYVL